MGHGVGGCEPGILVPELMILRINDRAVLAQRCFTFLLLCANYFLGATRGGYPYTRDINPAQTIAYPSPYNPSRYMLSDHATPMLTQKKMILLSGGTQE